MNPHPDEQRQLRPRQHHDPNNRDAAQPVVYALPPPTPSLAPSAPAPLALLTRTIAHAVVITIIANALSPVLETRPLGQHLLTLISPAGCIPWSVGASAGLNKDKLAMIILATITTIATWPNNLLSPAIAATTGIIIGHAVRQLLIREQQ